MEKFKEFYDKNKKIVIPAAIILVLLIAAGVYFISQPNDNADKKAENQIEEKVNVSQDNKTEGAEQSKVNASEKPSDDKSVSSDKAENSGNSSSSPNKSGGKKSSGKQSKDNTSEKHSDDNAENNGGWSDNGVENDYSGEQPAQTHTHHWKEHTVTEQVWVSKIVPVYETQSVQVGVNKVSDGIFWHCNCGAVIPMSDSDAHVFAHIEADEMDNGYTKEHFHDEPTYEEKQVQVGTKDEGHYETQSYVDYYYCDCGATK